MIIGGVEDRSEPRTYHRLNPQVRLRPKALGKMYSPLLASPLASQSWDRERQPSLRSEIVPWNTARRCLRRRTGSRPRACNPEETFGRSGFGFNWSIGSATSPVARPHLVQSRHCGGSWGGCAGNGAIAAWRVCQRLPKRTPSGRTGSVNAWWEKACAL